MFSLGLGGGPVPGVMESLVALATVDQESLGPEGERGHSLFRAGLPHQEGVEFGLFPEGDGK